MHSLRVVLRVREGFGPQASSFSPLPKAGGIMRIATKDSQRGRLRTLHSGMCKLSGTGQDELCASGARRSQRGGTLGA